MATDIITEYLSSTKPRRNTWLGVPGVSQDFALTRSALNIGTRVHTLRWEGGEHAGMVTVRHMHGDGRYASCRVFAEAVLPPAEVEAWVVERFTYRAGDTVERTQGRAADIGRTGVIEAIGECPGGDVLLVCRDADGGEFRCYTRQAAKR